MKVDRLHSDTRPCRRPSMMCWPMSRCTCRQDRSMRSPGPSPTHRSRWRPACTRSTRSAAGSSRHCTWCSSRRRHCQRTCLRRTPCTRMSELLNRCRRRMPRTPWPRSHSTCPRRSSCSSKRPVLRRTRRFHSPCMRKSQPLSTCQRGSSHTERPPPHSMCPRGSPSTTCWQRRRCMCRRDTGTHLLGPLPMRRCR